MVDDGDYVSVVVDDDDDDDDDVRGEEIHLI